MCNAIGLGGTHGVLVALTSLYPDLKDEAAKAVRMGLKA
jgi:hypothetical protein